MGTTRKMVPVVAFRALTARLLVALLAAVLLAGPAVAMGHEGPGKGARLGAPTAKAPSGAITEATPTFRWSKVAGTATYELRVYESSKLLLKKTGLAKPSWKSRSALPQSVGLFWKVRAVKARGAGAWSNSLSFTVVPAPVPSIGKAITAYGFQGLAPPVIGTIDETAHTIALTVPYGTPVTALVATFSTTGASVKVGSTLQVSGTTPNNFRKKVTYKVTASDGSTQTYVVTVTVTPDTPKAITAFSFLALAPPVTGTIKEKAHGIGLTVPYLTPVNALVATFTTTGASVKVGSVTQVSGTTANDFTSPVTYTVIAIDGTTHAYVVSVSFAPHVLAIGDYHQGGKIAYLLQPGDAGYSATVPHGLIATTVDHSAGTKWSNVTSALVGTTGTAIGTGRANTTAIVNQTGCTSGAAYVCNALVAGGYSDWYLPSKDELSKLYLNREAIGGFGSDWMDYYWSSSEYSASDAWYHSFTFGTQDHNMKGSEVIQGRVRPVRAF